MSYLVGLALLLVVGGGGYYLVAQKGATTGDEVAANWDGLSDDELVAAASKATTPGSTAVVYTNKGFLPSAVTIKLGQKVRFFNQSGEKLWVMQAPNPGAGNALPEFDQNNNITKGQAWELTFNKVGTFTYLNNSNPKMMGTVTVTAK